MNGFCMTGWGFFSGLSSDPFGLSGEHFWGMDAGTVCSVIIFLSLELNSGGGKQLKLACAGQFLGQQPVPCRNWKQLALLYN